MNFTNLRYFTIAARELNFTRAAQQLFVTQQCLCDHIRRLENELNVRLFDRSPTLQLTYAGKMLLGLAIQAENIEIQIKRQIGDIQDKKIDRLTIGTSYAYGRILLPEILPPFSRQFPQLEYNIISDVTKNLAPKLLTGEIDFTIGVGPFDSRLKTENLITEKLYMLIPNNIYSNIYSNIFILHNTINFKDFTDIPFLLVKNGNRLRDRVNHLFNTQKFTPKVLLECADTETVVSLCFQGMGVTFSFGMYLNQQRQNLSNKSNAVHCIPLEINLPGQVVIAYRQDKELRKSARNFLNFVRNYFSC